MKNLYTDNLAVGGEAQVFRNNLDVALDE